MAGILHRSVLHEAGVPTGAHHSVVMSVWSTLTGIMCCNVCVTDV